MNQSRIIAEPKVEKALLACLLLDPKLLDEATDYVSDDDFSSALASCAFRAMVAITERNGSIDTVTVESEMNAIEKRGGTEVLEWLLSLTDHLPTLRSVTEYAQRIRGLSQRRRMAEACKRIIAAAGDLSQSVDDFLSESESAVLAIAERREVRKPSNMATLAEKFMHRIDHPEAQPPRRPFGLQKLDRCMNGGAAAGDVVVVAGRPGMGKTAFMMCGAMGTARAGIPVLVHSLEMTSEQLFGRVVASTAGVNTSAVAGRMSEYDVNKSVTSLDLLSRLPIVIDDTPAVSLAQVRARARRVKREYGHLGMVVIDYLQLMTLVRVKGDTKDDAVGVVTKGLKVMAKELGVAVVLLAQLNRKVEERAGKRPQKSDLRESGNIEQDADTILLLHQPIENGEPIDGVADVIIDKQRGGAEGVVRVAFTKEFVRFATLAEQEPLDADYEDRRWV